MIKIKNMLYIIFFLILTVTCLANEYCPSEGCMNTFYYGPSTTPTYMSSAFSSIIPSKYDYNAFSSCNAIQALYTPTGGNLNGDISDNEYFYVTSTTNIQVYDTDCQYITELNLPSKYRIIAEANILDYDYDNLPEIAVLTNTSVLLYNFTNNTFNLQDNFTNYPVALGTSGYGSCTKTHCLSAANNLNVTITSLITGLSITKELFKPGNSFNYIAGHFSGTIYNGISYFYVCKYDGTISQFMNCALIKQDGTKIFNNYMNDGVYSGGTLSRNTFSYATVVNNVFRTAVTTYGDKSALTRFSDSIRNFAGTELFTSCKQAGSANGCEISTVSRNASSVWVFGNYDKSISSKLACHIYNSSLDNKIYFECWDDTFITPYYTIEITLAPLSKNVPKFFTMVDFNNSNDYLSIVTSDGIYYIDFLTQYIQYKYPWNYTTANTDFSTASILGNNVFDTTNPPSMWSSYATVAYSDTTHSTIVHPSPSLSSTCGNLICESIESIFSCPGDCLGAASTSLNCLRSTDCPSTYPDCLGNICTRGLNTSLTCYSDLDCPYLTPICIDGGNGVSYCVKTVSTIIEENETNTTLKVKRDLQSEADMRGLLDILFFGSSFLKLLVAIIFIIIIMAETANYAKGNPFVISLSGIFGLILFTVLGMIPIFIVLILFVGLILMLVYSKALFPSTN